MNMSTLLEEDVQEQGSIVNAALERFGKQVAVCSYHFMPINEVRDYKTVIGGTYNTRYKAAAVLDRQLPPQMIIFRDGFQRVFGGTDDQGKKKYSNEPEPAIHIAQDIVKAASGALHSGPEVIAPAVWIVQAAKYPRTSKEWATWGTPQFTATFPEFERECKAYNVREFRYAETIVADGDTWHNKSQPFEITERHRNAAQWTGANEAEHPWMKLTKFGSRVQCPLCGHATSATHPKCENCHDVIDYALYNSIQARLKQDSEPMQAPPPALPALTAPARA